MNVLPLILALVLMLSVLTVEKLEKFKHQKIVQEQYQKYLSDNERQKLNDRQERLFGHTLTTDRQQVSFRYIVDKKLREKDPEKAAQYRLIIIDLIKNVYGEAKFFKDLEKTRGNFVEELLTAIEQAADRAPPKTVLRIEDISRLQLEDPLLQKAFYHMLKGTMSKEAFNDLPKDSPLREKAYVSLLTFINKDNQKGIEIQHAPVETLKAIFGSDEIANRIVIRRKELSKQKEESKNDNKTGGQTFANEFKGKQRSGISDDILDFKISSSDTTPYD